MTTRLASERSVLSAAAPEPGQLVEVRRRQWIVSDVDASAVSPELPKRNLIKLSSIDEDSLGEEIASHHREKHQKGVTHMYTTYPGYRTWIDLASLTEWVYSQAARISNRANKGTP